MSFNPFKSIGQLLSSQYQKVRSAFIELASNVSIKPLPEKSNVMLFKFMILVWIFAILISFFGDSLAFILIGGSILAIYAAICLCLFTDEPV